MGDGRVLAVIFALTRFGIGMAVGGGGDQRFIVALADVTGSHAKQLGTEDQSDRQAGKQ